ncbi:cystathionine beta-lyase [Parvibaculum lavamentivorans DS-1]|uniref:Cystathionine beta-lyase n=1 Tax=Parvibaculum lavamentivorans (strain DS-1 / DSM 13023 / NCIMB 13966) TaxID=402881 RepID=A7HXF7_PARL1|nr:cystathionine beta-lyase [Parvibaculum lavamentivorans]ABS64590.1 cystathionine beta-lyase [Parvibaculum lavamentivorans DS-1]
MKKKQDTLIVTAGRDPEANFGIVNPPVYHASTVLYPTLEAVKTRAQPVTYGRRGTPTTFALQDAIAELEGGYRSLLTPSGLAAVTTALLAHLKSGDHLLMTDSVYEPSRQFCDKVLTRYGIDVEYYDPRIGAGIAALIRPETKVIFTEAPGSVTFEVQDIPAIAAAAHGADALLMMDNTWASPLYFKPFEHGVDVSIQAVTKYLCGHSDVMMGAITTTEAAWNETLATHGALGVCTGPDDIYLVLRGIRTLSVRLERHMETGLKLARWLAARPEVTRVIHPALPDHPDHAIWKRDFTGASGLFSIELIPCSEAALAAFLDGLELFGMGYSWGGFESLIIPQYPAKIRTATKWNGTGQILRLHAGLEDADDLIADLEAGFERFHTA